MPNQALLFVTASPNPAEPEAMQEYLQRVLPLFLAAGGTLLGRGAVQETVAGTVDYKMVMVMAFEDIAAAKAVLDTEDYRDLIAIRDRGFAKIDIALARSL